MLRKFTIVNCPLLRNCVPRNSKAICSLSSIRSKYQTWKNHRNIGGIARKVAKQDNLARQQAPVVFFNASARLSHLSQNAAFSLIASWGLRLGGVPVVHFVCNEGMSRCVLGTNPDDAGQAPPCAACIAQSERLFSGADVRRFTFQNNPKLQALVSKSNVGELKEFEYEGQALGQMVLPALRWALRRHTLLDDENTRRLYREYVISAYSLGQQFGALLDAERPQATVIFNGIMYPEAMARWQAQQRGIQVITHEVGLQPLTAFFTEGHATAYPMDIPDDFHLAADENLKLDQYLEQRFQGKFSMAGINFWSDMQGLSEEFKSKASKFEHVVPIFTNVIFDTSQVHANRRFENMFDWLNQLLNLITDNPKTLFVIRAHPDEMRPNSKKQSRESVRDWVISNGIHKMDNVIFFDSNETVSSYALIQRAHFVMVYNSSIGLEASIMGRPVLCAGGARYTQYPTVYFPRSADAYMRQAKSFLEAERVEQPESFTIESRRVLYFQLFRTSLPFEEFLEPHSRMGYVNIKNVAPEQLSPQNSDTISRIFKGVVNDDPFLL